VAWVFGYVKSCYTMVMPKESTKEHALETKKPAEPRVNYKSSRTWIWVLIVVLVAVLGTAAVAGYVVSRGVTVIVDNSAANQ